MCVFPCEWMLVAWIANAFETTRLNYVYFGSFGVLLDSGVRLCIVLFISLSSMTLYLHTHSLYTSYQSFSGISFSYWLWLLAGVFVCACHNALCAYTLK